MGIKCPTVALDFDMAAALCIKHNKQPSDIAQLFAGFLGVDLGGEKEPKVKGKSINQYSEEELTELLRPKVMGRAKVKDGRLVDYFDEHGIAVVGM